MSTDNFSEVAQAVSATGKKPVYIRAVSTIVRGATGKVEKKTEAYWDRNPLRNFAWAWLEKHFRTQRWAIALRYLIERKPKTT